MGNLEGKLEAVKMLKEEYGIGSQDAWKYLKVQNEVDRIHKESGALVTGISKEEVAQTMYRFDEVISDLFRSAGFDEGTYYHIDFAEFYEGSRPDYLLLMKNYVNWRTAFKSELENNERPIDSKLNFVMLQGSFFYTIGDLLNSEETVGTLKGTTFHLGEFLNNEIENKFPKCESADIERLIEYSNLKNEKLNLEEVVSMSDRFRNNYDFMFVKKIPIHERKYLYQAAGGAVNNSLNELYQTAKNERTLRRFESQRKIALSYIILNDSDSIDNAVDTLKKEAIRTSEQIKKEKEKIEACQYKTMNEAIAEEAKNILNNKEFFKIILKGEETTLEAIKYAIHAIVSNRSWLEKVLKH